MTSDLSTESEGKPIGTSKKKILGLSALRLLRLAIALLNLALSAKYFGATIDRDLWLLSFTTINVIQNSLWGPLNETFRAKFIFIKEDEGQAEAMQKTSSLLTFTVLLTFIFLFILLLFTAPITKLIAPGNSIHELSELGFMLKVLAPSLLLVQVSILLTSILNAYDIFSYPEIVGSITSVLGIIILVSLVPYVGIYALAFSYYISTGLLLAILIYEVRENKIPLYIGSISFKFSQIKPFILFSLPFFAAHFFSQINSLTEKSIASTIGHGSVSIIDYSRKFIDIPLQVAFSVLGTIMIPNLSKKFKIRDIDGFRIEFLTMLKLGLFFFGPFIGLLILGAKNITDIIYNRGKMDNTSLQYISELAIYYGLSSLAIFCFSIFGFSHVSRDHAKSFAICASLAHIGITSINFLFFQKVGILLFPMSLLLCYTLVALVMIIKFQWEVGGILNTLATYGKFIIFITVMCYTAKLFIFPLGDHLPSLVQLLIKTIFLLTISIIWIFFSNMEEKIMLYNTMNKVKSKIMFYKK